MFYAHCRIINDSLLNNLLITILLMHLYGYIKRRARCLSNSTLIPCNKSYDCRDRLIFALSSSPLSAVAFAAIAGEAGVTPGKGRIVNPAMGGFHKRLPYLGWQCTTCRTVRLDDNCHFPGRHLQPDYPNINHTSR